MQIVIPLDIAGRKVGDNHPCFVIAEAGVNHNGSVDLAMKMIDAAVAARVDAVKFQTFSAAGLVSPTAPKAQYQLESTDKNESQYEMLSRLELSADAHRRLFNYCMASNILFLSTPFDHSSIELLNTLPVSAFKISSGDLTNLPLLNAVAKTGKPLIVSTGMAYLHEVEEAVAAIEAQTKDKLALLHCVSNYPANPEDVNLYAMSGLQKRFAVPIGYSDHTLGTEVAVAAVALGAKIIEKHFTLDSSMPGPDHRASLEPHELKKMVDSIRTVEKSLGSFEKKPAPCEIPIAAIGRKSLHWQDSLMEGDIVQPEHIVVLRPGTGMPPRQMQGLVHRRLARSVQKGTMITPEDFGA